MGATAYDRKHVDAHQAVLPILGRPPCVEPATLLSPLWWEDCVSRSQVGFSIRVLRNQMDHALGRYRLTCRS